MAIITLNCYVCDGGSSWLVQVKIKKEETVAALKDAIKDKNKPNLDHIAAHSLVLYKVSVPFVADLKVDVGQLDKLQDLDSLLDIFPSELEKKNIHIVVGVPPPVNPFLTLFCYVKGDPYNNVFEVKIEKEESVAALKDAIKEKAKPKFDHIAAYSLVLWAVSIPQTSTLMDNVDALPLLEEIGALPPLDEVPDQLSSPVGYLSEPRASDLPIPSLLGASMLSEVFSKPPIKGNVHIIVKPPLARSTSKKTNVREDDDAPTELKTFIKTNRQAAIEKALKAGSPSISAKSKEYRRFQRNYPPIFDGLYDVDSFVNTTAPPIQLFHPVFGHFLDGLSSDSPVPVEITKATIEYMRVSSGIYQSEAKRRDALEPYLGQILGITMGSVVNPDGTSADGAYAIALTNGIDEVVVTIIREDKNNFGDGGCDPSTQVGLSMTRFWAQKLHSVVRNHTCCPTFLVATAGPWIVILGAIFTSNWIVQRLTDFIWVGLDATLNEPHYHRVARIMYSLRQNLKKLSDYYRALKFIPIDTENIHRCIFPSICAYRDEESDTIINFEYIKPLECDQTCVTFLARTISDTPGFPKDIVVKYVDRYGVEPHRLLAEKSLAPKLFYHGKIGGLEGDPSYGHLRMVVMEYIDGKTFDQMEHIPPTFMQDIQRALMILHDNRYVFGDLRGPNIMITKNGELKLIDFDWAGEAMKSQYPPLISCSIRWPDGVEALSVMKIDHDNKMLAALLDETPISGGPFSTAHSARTSN